MKAHLQGLDEILINKLGMVTRLLADNWNLVKIGVEDIDDYGHIHDSSAACLLR